MSDKKLRRHSNENNSSHPRDQQFRVQTLASDSSQDGSRKDNDHYEIKYFDGSDEDSEQKRSHPDNKNSKTKSMQDITVAVDNKHLLVTINQIQSTENPHQIHQSNSQFIHKFDKDVKRNDNNDEQLSYESGQQDSIQKKRRKRQQIYRNIRHKNTEKQEIQQKRFQNKQIEALNKVAFERKRQNHGFLKHWNYNRIHVMDKHRKITEQLLSSVDKNVKLSLQNFEVYKTFYAQRCRQQESYLISKVSGTQRFLESDACQIENKVGRNIYIACSTALQSLAHKDRAMRELSAELCTVIQTKILKQIFDQYLDNVHKQSRALRSKITKTKQILSELDESICKKLIRLEANFTQCCQNIIKEATEDFYCIELSFLRKCESEIKMQAQYGRLIMQYWKYVASEEEMRGQLVEKSLKIYNQASTKYQKQTKMLSNKKQIINSQIQTQHELHFQQNLINQISHLYQLQNLLDIQFITEISSTVPQNKNNGSWNLTEQLSAYLRKCEIQEFDFHHLILKKFEIQLFKEHRWMPSELVITVDKFVHIFINALSSNSGVLVYGGQKFYKPQVSLKASDTQIRFTIEKQSQDEIDSDDELEIVIANKQMQSGFSKLTSFLVSSSKIMETVRFSKEDDLLEFQDFITELSF